jgi:hypothetical protein
MTNEKEITFSYVKYGDDSERVDINFNSSNMTVGEVVDKFVLFLKTTQEFQGHLEIVEEV